jgi:hypothetical protein
MTPKEKAFDLFSKFNGGREPVTIEMWNAASDYAKENLRKDALIAVDCAVSVLDGMHKPEYSKFDAIGPRKFTLDKPTEYDSHLTGYELMEYWMQVAVEIKAL